MPIKPFKRRWYIIRMLKTHQIQIDKNNHKIAKKAVLKLYLKTNMSIDKYRNIKNMTSIKTYMQFYKYTYMKFVQIYIHKYIYIYILIVHKHIQREI